MIKGRKADGGRSSMLRTERDETVEKLKTLEEVNKLKDEEIEEMKKKIEGLEEMNLASKAEIVVLQKSKDEIEIKNKKMIKYEFEPLRKNHQNALNEISKLTHFIRIYGTFTLHLYHYSQKWILPAL